MTTETSNARGEWVLVPRVPTEAMKVAALQQAAPLGEIVDWQFDIDDETVDREAVAGIYTAMLAAAPQPPAEAQAVAKLVNRKDSDGGKTTTFIRPTSLGMDLPLGEYPLHLHPPPSAPVGVEGLVADLETIWHSVSDDKETNAAYQRLKAALAQQPAAGAEALSHADLCRLSRVFNAHNVPGLDQDRRINEWLGKRIAAALATQHQETTT